MERSRLFIAYYPLPVILFVIHSTVTVELRRVSLSPADDK